MTLDLALSALVNAAGAFLFLVVGVFMLVVGRRRAAALAAVAALLGLTYIFENLVVPDSPSAALLISASPAGLVIAEIILVLWVARDIPPSDRARLAAFAVVIALLAATTAVGASLDPLVAERAYAFGSSPASTPVTLAFDVIAASWGGLLVVAAALALRAKAASDAHSRRAWLLAALAFGLFGAFVTTALALTFATPTVGAGTIFLVGSQGLVASVAIAACFFLPSRACAEPRIFRSAFLAFALTSLLGCALAAALAGRLVASDFGAFGIVRTLGVALLVMAIAKHDLLGVPLPHLAQKRGVLAASAMALLFIVAQIAQNFLAAQYGLLMGGVVAGAFLFAAAPLQRAMERMGEQRIADRTSGSGPAHRAASDDRTLRREDVYRKALRFALKDAQLTREEELHLHQLAEELSIPGSRAHELLIEVEQEKGVR